MKNYLKKNKLVLMITVLFSIVSSVAAVFLAKLLQKVIDAATNGDKDSFLELLLISVAYIVFLGVISYLYSLFSKLLVRNLTMLLRQRVFEGILRRNTSDFASVNTADYISAFTNDVKLIEENLILPSLLVLQYGVIFIVTLILLFDISPLITLCLTGCVIVMLILPGLLGKPMQNRQELLSKQFSVFTGSIKDYLLGYEVIRSFQIKGHIMREFTSENEKTSNAKYRSDRLFSLNEGVSGILAYLTQFSGLFIGAYLIIKGEISAGTLVALIQLSGTFVSPVMMILQNVPKIKSITPVVERLKGLSDYADTSFKGNQEPQFQDTIEVNNLSFAYEGDREILHGVNLTIHKGKKYAIVGKSGCGKSTLVKLLTGCYCTYNGSITYDGLSLHELKIDEVYNIASVIHQNVYMFDKSLSYNICLEDVFSDKDMGDSLRTSGVMQFLGEIEGGLEYQAGENGANLSGGQRQRIAIARALIRHKSLMVLDEGTSAVDMKTAYDIERSLLAVNDLTLVTITHNLDPELLGQYDQIIYMDDGTIAETGSLDELLSGQGGFCEFANMTK